MSEIDRLVSEFPEVYAASKETLERSYSALPRGWYPILANLSRAIAEEDPEGFLVHQIKEKFGGLRFYCGPTSPHIRNAIAAAEEQSFLTCESCEAPGVLRGGSWLRTKCDACCSPEELAAPPPHVLRTIYTPEAA